MSGRSSRRELGPAIAALALAAAGCGKRAAPPEADPAAIERLAATMVHNVPLPGAARACTPAELVEPGATLTGRTLYALAKRTPATEAAAAAWVNPPELDSPAARTLRDAKDATARRRAAAELLGAPSWLVYHVDLVDTPLALGVKDFKRGYVGARAIRYDRRGAVRCAQVFYFTNTPAKQRWAIEHTDRPGVADEVRDELRRDLRARMLDRVTHLAEPPPPDDGPADDREDRQ